MRFCTVLLSAAVLSAAFLPGTFAAVPSSLGPAFSSDPQLEKGYRLLYQQQFPEARAIFQKWIEEHPDEPFGDVSLAASYLFEEFFLQNVLTSDYFLDDKRFLGGITGTPNPQLMKGFQDCSTSRKPTPVQKYCFAITPMPTTPTSPRVSLTTSSALSLLPHVLCCGLVAFTATNNGVCPKSKKPPSTVITSNRSRRSFWPSRHAAKK